MAKLPQVSNLYSSKVEHLDEWLEDHSLNSCWKNSDFFSKYACVNEKYIILKTGHV